MSDNAIQREDETQVVLAVHVIQVGTRLRRDLGDVEGLAQSIAELGLLSPITVSADWFVVCGARRLAAIKLLGWKQVKVQVRYDLSDPLRALVAERDDEAHRKAYNPLEQAKMYAELNLEIAADAARNVAAARFASGQDHPRSRNRRSDGLSNLGSPSEQAKHIGRSKKQAAATVGGLSHHTLDKINEIDAIASDAARTAQLRHKAGRALTGIRDGRPVDPAYREIKALATIDDLVAIVENPELSDVARTSAREAIGKIEAANQTKPLSAAGINRIVSGALGRVRAIENRISKDGKQGDGSAVVKKWKSAKEFTYLWNNLTNWPDDYNPVEIAAEVPHDKWAAFEQTMAAANKFTETVNRHRAKAEAKSQAP